MSKDRDKVWYVDQFNRNRPHHQWIKNYLELEALRLQMQEIEKQNREVEKNKNENKQKL